MMIFISKIHFLTFVNSSFLYLGFRIEVFDNLNEVQCFITSWLMYFNYEVLNQLFIANSNSIIILDFCIYNCYCQ